MGMLQRETLHGEMLDEGIGWRCWVEMRDGEMLDRGVGWRC